MKAKDWTGASDDELVAEINRLDGERVKLREQMLDLHAILDRNTLATQAQRRLAGMGEAERAALVQELAVPTITTKNRVGATGSSGKG